MPPAVEVQSLTTGLPGKSPVVHFKYIQLYLAIIPQYSLRVNLDGDGIGRIDEVKTYNLEKGFKVTKAYWQQVQVQIFAKRCEEFDCPKAHIWAYGLLPEDYKNFFNPIDRERLKPYPIEEDKKFIEEYLRRIVYLKSCMERGVMPDESFAM